MRSWRKENLVNVSMERSFFCSLIIIFISDDYKEKARGWENYNRRDCKIYAAKIIRKFLSHIFSFGARHEWEEKLSLLSLLLLHMRGAWNCGNFNFFIWFILFKRTKIFFKKQSFLPLNCLPKGQKLRNYLKI